MRASHLIKCIIQLPDTPPKGSRLDGVACKIDGLFSALQITDTRSVNNAAMIINLEASNKMLKEQNNEIKVENQQLKMQLNSHKEQLENTAQYLRINNIEIAGLTQVEDTMEEDVILEVLNKLDNTNVTSEDIDVCHSIPTRRHDGKSVHAVKYISRKKNIDILRGNPICINGHLAPNNIRLFSNAMMKKHQLNDKILWIRNGFVYM